MSSSSKQEKNNDHDDHNNTNGSLKKGTWSKEEDKILIDYVKEHGTKNWNAIQKKGVLNRDGKSCRFRWLNNLKPGVKKGSFSEQEVEEVIRMEGLGLSWCQMAKQLPGRSDNAIKNFCNSRKRKNENPKLSGSSSLSDGHDLNDNRVNENNYSNQLPKLVDDSNKQLPKFSKLVDDSKMLYNNVGSTSISNHTTPSSWTNRASIGGTSFMHEARAPNLSTFPGFQNMDYPLPSIEPCFHTKYPSRYVKINENNSKQLPNLFDVANKQLPKFSKWVDDSNVGTASTSNHTTPTRTNYRAVIGNCYVNLSRVPNQNMNYSLPSLEHSLYRKYPSISNEINNNNSEQLSNSFQVPNKKELPKLVDDSNMFYNNEGNISTSNHTAQTWINRGGNGTSSMQCTMVPNRLPPCPYIQSMGYQHPSYKKLGEYPQNPLPPPKEAQYHMTESVSPYRSGSRKSRFHTVIKKIREDFDATRVGSSKVNLVDEKGKKPISFENDFGANFHSNFTDPCLRDVSRILLDNDDNNNLNDKLPHDVNDTLDAAINEKGIDWDILSNFGSLDNDDNNNLHLKLPDNVKDTLVAAINGKDIDSSYNDNNNNLHDKIPHDIKDTLDAVIYGKSFHPK